MSSAQHFYLRYLIVIALLSYFLIVVYMAKFIDKLRSNVLIILTGYTIFFTINIYSLAFGFFMNGSTYYNHQLKLLEKHNEINSPVASAQTGTIGYFYENVLNLDGKTNYEAIIYKDDMVNYLDIKKIKWFCDWKEFAVKYLGENYAKNGWVLKDSLGRFYLYYKNL